MPRPTGSQFVRLYRGLHRTSPEGIENQPTDIGSHWTSQEGIAYDFATIRNFGDQQFRDDDYTLTGKGTIVEALVHKRNIIDPNSKEWNRTWSGSVFEPTHPEKETTVRPGAPVHIQRFHHVDDSKKEYYVTKPMRRKGYRA